MMHLARILVLVTGALAPVVLRGQISPGALAKAHAPLEGALNCTKCHGPRKSAMNASCQACHREIAWLVERNRGYHAGREARARQDCASCHPDHAGRDFALIAWPGGSPDRFDHRSAGWSLDGAHADLKCAECHAMEYRASASAALSKRTGSAGWTGLETTCVSCHQKDDEHRGALRSTCNDCHDSRDWKPAPRFSHDSTAYPLTGKHDGVECNACHLSKRLSPRRDAEGHEVPVYKPVPFRSCANCHDDPHRGRLSSRCADCHSTSGFESVESRAFNHALTRYPLKGEHARATCESCHGVGLTRKNPAFDTCGGCHRDPHQGQALLAGKPADCGACHRVDGFAHSSFTIAQHAQSPYPLAGRHAQVACAKCHTPVATTGAAAAPVGRLRMRFSRCTDCHVDAHGGQLASRAGGGACEGCHGVGGWAPSTFTAAQHAGLRLKLEGRHAEIPCRSCHAADRAGLPVPAVAGGSASLGSAHVAITLSGGACVDCHVDPHGGRYGRSGAVPLDGECSACHGASSFRPSFVDAARHDRFSFRLEGAHRAVACVACHQELHSPRATSTLLGTARGVVPFPVIATTSRTCGSCHENPHGDQFLGRRKSTCESCHGIDAFAPATRFDHERDAAFSLRGGHAKVACSSCHAVKRVGETAMAVYRPVSAKCETCHDKRKEGRS